MEFGARALGNRSIIADASNINIKDIINKKSKEEKTLDHLLLLSYMNIKMIGSIQTFLIHICLQLKV